MRTRFTGIALAALVLTASAYSSVVQQAPPVCEGNACFQLGNHPQPNEELIMFHTAQTGFTVNGFTDTTNTEVKFTSSQSLTAKGGQSDVDAASGTLSNITITVPGHDFDDYILNPFKDHGTDNIEVTVVLSDGVKETFGPYGGHGNNFLTITTTGGLEISKILVAATDGGIDGLQQNRISGIEIIPEPSSMLLLGSGVLILAQGLRRKLKLM